MERRQTIIRLLTILVTALCSLATGWWLGANYAEDIPPSPESRETRAGKYVYINPLLECEVYADADIKELKPFKSRIKLLVQDKIAAGEATEIAVYFRDLNNGPWFGINEKVKFSPASLMKVPVMMAYLKMAETVPALLSTKLSYDSDMDLNDVQAIKPNKTLSRGLKYSVEELIRRMIVYSDNNAYKILIDNIERERLDDVLSELHIDYSPSEYEDLLTLKDYSGFFRILFNATYLNKEMSEKALAILADDEFRTGVMAAIPNHIQVASKFGEWSQGEGNSVLQLHEVGIVYYPGHPYLIGIMTRGHKLDTLMAVIRDIAAKSFAEVDLQHKMQR